MPDFAANSIEPASGFQIKDMMMRYNLFAPRLYNWCKTLGFEPGRIMPSRAFCSDESQGYPIIMIAKHFGTFPFNHGRVGGIVATDRHAPHAEHGQDLVIIQASHVGYDPQIKDFGTYRRLQTIDQSCSPSCGKLHQIISWYQNEYRFAQKNILLTTYQGQHCIIIDNQLIREDRDQGLFIQLNKLVESDPDNQCLPLKTLSTAKLFKASPALVRKLGETVFSMSDQQAIGSNLTADMFYFRRNIPTIEEGVALQEYNLMRYMQHIITSPSPMLTAAKINTQIEFDRTFRTIVKEHAYHGKKVLFIAGLNIDISPQSEQLFPLTKFTPWAAYLQDRDGSYITYEQEELVQTLEQQSTENPDKINLEEAIQIMTEAEEIKIEFE